MRGYVSALNRLDLLICNAAILCDRPVLQMSPADFNAVLSVNLSGAWHAARAALRFMVPQRCGHLVFIGSFAALQGTAGQSNYAAAKAGLCGLAASLAREYGSRNIRVNTVLPGFVDTRMTSHLSAAHRAEFRKQHALGRFNTADAVARFIAFLDQQLPHTSGQIFNLDSRIPRWT